MLKTTALNAAHRAMGAKMVDFSGWDMPLHYGSQIDEHHKVRRDAGMFDVSHMLAIDFRGDGTRDYLRHLLANNVDRLQIPGKAMYSCMLNEQGGVLDDLIVYFMREDWFRIVVNAATCDKDLAWMRQQRDAFGSGVEIPRILREVKPAYTADAMRAKIQGIVELEAVVLPDGSVGDVSVTRSLDRTFGLDNEAIKAVRQWRFAPGTRLGRPVPVLVTIELTFTLR